MFLLGHLVLFSPFYFLCFSLVGSTLFIHESLLLPGNIFPACWDELLLRWSLISCQVKTKFLQSLILTVLGSISEKLDKNISNWVITGIWICRICTCFRNNLNHYQNFSFISMGTETGSGLFLRFIKSLYHSEKDQSMLHLWEWCSYNLWKW